MNKTLKQIILEAVQSFPTTLTSAQDEALTEHIVKHLERALGLKDEDIKHD